MSKGPMVPSSRPPMATRIARIWHKLRAPAEGDHGAQRWRKIFISSGGALFSRIFGFGCNLLMIPIALRYLGAERYGLWVTLTSSVALLTFFDFGVGIGLQNRVAMLLGKDQLNLVAQSMRSTLAVLLAIVTILFAVLALIIYRTNISTVLFHDPHFVLIDLKGSLLIIVGAFVLGLPMGLFARMAFGLQQGWIASVAASCGTGLGLLAVFVASRIGLDFKGFIAFTVVPPIVAQLLGYFLLSRRVEGGLPLFGKVSIKEGLDAVRQGSHYMLPQISWAISTQGPLVFLGTMSSPVDAAAYSVLTRISMPFQQLQQMFLIQVWPAITEALHRGDTGWLKTTLKRILKLNLAFGAGAVFCVTTAVLVLFPLLTKSAPIQTSFWVVIIYAVSVGLMCVVQGLAYMANGLSRLRSQNYLALISMVFAFVAFPFAASHLGILGIVSALVVLNGLFSVPLLYREYRLYFSEQSIVGDVDKSI